MHIEDISNWANLLSLCVTNHLFRIYFIFDKIIKFNLRWSRSMMFVGYKKCLLVHETQLPVLFVIFFSATSFVLLKLFLLVVLTQSGHILNERCFSPWLLDVLSSKETVKVEVNIKVNLYFQYIYRKLWKISEFC